MGEENFGYVYDNMNKNYGELADIISKIYQYHQDNPDDENAIHLAQDLGNIATNMISLQREITMAYCDSNLKSSLIDNLDDKTNGLEKVMDDIRGRKR